MANGRPHGVGHSWYPSRQLQSETPFQDGVAHGVWKHWAEDGRLLGTFEVVEGTGLFHTWYDDGRPRTEVSTVRGLPTGRVRHWDEAGEITDGFMFKGRKISRKRYASLAASDRSLPRYDDVDQKTRI